MSHKQNSTAPPTQKINIKFYKLFELLGVQVEERGLWNKLRFIIT